LLLRALTQFASLLLHLHRFALMAPATKRASTSTAGAPPAKKHQAVPRAKLTSVAKALKATESYPQSVVTLLSQNVDLSLGVAKEERHDFQSKFVDMIAEVLDSVQKALEQKIADAESKISQADSEKEKREAAVKEATLAVEALTEALKAAESALQDACQKHEDSQKALTAAKQEQEAGDASLHSASNKKDTLEILLKDSFEPVKTGSLEEPKVKGAIAALTKAGKEFSFDHFLITSFGSALTKPSAERGNFDVLVVDQLESALKHQIELFSSQLTEGAAGLEERAAKVATAATDLEAVVDAKKAAENAVADTKKQLKEAQQVEKASNKLLKQLGPELKTVQTELAELKNASSDFLAGPYADFKELAERSIHPAVVEASNPPADVQPELPAEA
jgi:septal ring factor EnvC (AmiA/AmiB activator)